MKWTPLDGSKVDDQEAFTRQLFEAVQLIARHEVDEGFRRFKRAVVERKEENK